MNVANKTKDERWDFNKDVHYKHTPTHPKHTHPHTPTQRKKENLKIQTMLNKNIMHFIFRQRRHEEVPDFQTQSKHILF